MDIFAILDQYGIPAAVALAFGYFIWKQNNWIQDELMEELDERFKRLEGIVIKLIDQNKITQLDIKELKGYVEGIQDIMKKLTGNKLKERD
jgi:hypothetical protein